MRFRLTRLIVLICGSICLAGHLVGSAWAAARLAIPGTTVSLSAPAGFEPASGFAGLQNTKTRASVMVAELPIEGYGQISTLFGNLETAKSNFARQNVVVTALDSIDTAAGRIPLISGTQQAGGLTFDKWVGLFRGAKTVMITVQAPAGSGLTAATVRALMASVTLGAEPGIEAKIGSLPFAVAAAAPFRIVDAIGGSTVLMTVGPKNTDPSGKQPLLIVAYQLSGALGSNAADIAASVLVQTRGLEKANVTTRKAIRFAGRDGYLLAGTGEGGMRFGQYLATGPEGRFVRLIAMAEPKTFEELQPTIAKVAATVAFKPSGTSTAR